MVLQLQYARSSSLGHSSVQVQRRVKTHDRCASNRSPFSPLSAQPDDPSSCRLSVVDAKFTTVARRRRLFHNNVANPRHRSAVVHRRLIFIDCWSPPLQQTTEPATPRSRSRRRPCRHDVIAYMLMRPAHSIISAPPPPLLLLLLLLLLLRGNW